MSNITVTLNPGSGGAAVAFFQDSTQAAHQYVIVETRTGTNDPVPVGATNPLPVIFNTAQSIVGNVGAGTADTGFGVKVAGVYNTTAPVLNTGERGDLQVDGSGNLMVNIAAGAAAGGTSSNFSASFPGAGTAVGALNSAGTQMQPLKLDAGGNLQVNVAAGSVQAVTDNSSAFTAGSTQALGIAGAYNDSAGAVTSGNMAIPRITANRQLRHVQDAATNGGSTAYSLISAATTNATNVKASAGQLYALYVTNIASTPRYLKFYNSATAPTAGSGTPIWRIGIPGNTAGSGGAIAIPPGLAFSSGIGFTITGGAGDSDTTAIGSQEVLVNAAYA